MNKIFPDITKGRKLVNDIIQESTTTIKESLISYLPKRINKKMSKGELYLAHCTDNFASSKTKQYVDAVLEVEKMLLDEGYHVESYLCYYNQHYSNIIMLISWDIDSLTADIYSMNRYQKYRVGDRLYR